MYRRRAGLLIQHKGKTLSNKDVVPFNIYLLLKFECHINVEVCCSMNSIKYLFKYFYKGKDRAMLELRFPRGLQDEVEKYQCTR